jgi:hypothetical protein
MNTDDKFMVEITNPGAGWYSTYFQKFWWHCDTKARANGQKTVTVANHELQPLGGKLFQTQAGGWYLGWDNEASHTAFILKWS